MSLSQYNTLQPRDSVTLPLLTSAKAERQMHFFCMSSISSLILQYLSNIFSFFFAYWVSYVKHMFSIL